MAVSAYLKTIFVRDEKEQSLQTTIICNIMIEIIAYFHNLQYYTGRMNNFRNHCFKTRSILFPKIILQTKFGNPLLRNHLWHAKEICRTISSGSHPGISYCTYFNKWFSIKIIYLFIQFYISMCLFLETIYMIKAESFSS